MAAAQHMAFEFAFNYIAFYAMYTMWENGKNGGLRQVPLWNFEATL